MLVLPFSVLKHLAPHVLTYTWHLLLVSGRHFYLLEQPTNNILCKYVGITIKNSDEIKPVHFLWDPIFSPDVLLQRQ